eukprot:1151824-Pelagomonas_calceolata.AAC.3
MCEKECVIAAAIAANSALTYGVCHSTTVGLNTIFAVSERVVDACSNFLFAILNMTAAISACPCPSVRDFGHEGWTRLVRYKVFFMITYVWIGWVSRYFLFV